MVPHYKLVSSSTEDGAQTSLEAARISPLDSLASVFVYRKRTGDGGYAYGADTECTCATELAGLGQVVSRLRALSDLLMNQEYATVAVTDAEAMAPAPVAVPQT